MNKKIDDDIIQEYSLTYEGKPFITLKTSQRMNPGDALITMINALTEHVYAQEKEKAAQS